MAKEVNLDKELEKAPETEYPELPLSCEVPNGWKRICVSNNCDCWYQEALEYERLTGNKVVPIEINKTGVVVQGEEE